MIDKILTVEELASILHITPNSVYDMVKKNLIPYFKVGKMGRIIRFKADDINKWSSEQQAIKGSQEEGR